jgi:hypothetical protein
MLKYRHTPCQSSPSLSAGPTDMHAFAGVEDSKALVYYTKDMPAKALRNDTGVTVSISFERNGSIFRRSLHISSVCPCLR